MRKSTALGLTALVLLLSVGTATARQSGELSSRPSLRRLTRSVLPRFPFANEFQIGLNLPVCLATIAAAGLFIGLFGSSVSIRRFLRI